MKLANKVYIVTLILLLLAFTVPAQDRPEKDDRNTAPTVGGGGPVGGPTGLFTVYDGQTLRKGEFTFSIAASNYDRDPGNVDITSVPFSFQVGLTNKFELFFNTETFRGVKVNNPRMLSGFYLPNTQPFINGSFQTLPAIVLAPSGPGPNALNGAAIFRPTGFQPFLPYPFVGGSTGAPGFGFPVGTNALIGVNGSGGSIAAFPGLGSVYGGLLPGVVLATSPIVGPNGTLEAPVTFTLAPSYIADAPFINRTWGTSSFNSMDFGFKWRFNDVEESVGYGLIGYYRWYLDNSDDASGFNMLQRGAGPGSDWGDIGAIFFADARLATWANLSGNVGYVYTSKSSGTFNGTEVGILDRPDEFQASIGVDFPINKYLQPILEFRALRYVGGRTPNAFERHPIDGLMGLRVYPRRWFGFGVAYRRNFNQMDNNSFDQDTTFTSSVTVPCIGLPTGCVPVVVNNSFTGAPTGFIPSDNPHGYVAQFWIGRRDARAAEIVNLPPAVNSVAISDTTITLPCAPGFHSTSGACNDSRTVTITTSASDPENDVLTYNYTVSGGKIVGTGANVQWDLATATPGTYTITTGVDDGCGVCGKTDTQTITVVECPDCVQDCVCPPLSVSGPSGITNPGDAMTFTASSSGDVTYNWTVSAGTIESGQGTPSITVRTNRDMAGTNVTATVDIGGLPAGCNCPASASETAPVAARPEANLIDQFGPATDDDVKARVDNFYTQLNNNPSAQGYIINYGTPAEIKRRRAQIMKAINFRKFDASRVTFIDGPDNGTGVNTKFYVVPAGAENPAP